MDSFPISYWWGNSIYRILVLGLGLDATSFERPLWIFDNKYSLDFDGIEDGVQIARDTSMITDSFTVGLWVGNAEVEWDQNSVGNVLFGNRDSSGWELTHANKRVTFTLYIATGTTTYSLESITAGFNKMSYAGGSGYGASDNFSTGDGGWNMIVATFHGGVLKLYIGGGVDNGGSGMGNDLHLVGTNDASGTGTTVSYGAKSYSDNVDFGIGCGFMNAPNSFHAPSKLSIDNAFYFSQALSLSQLQTMYNSGQGVDMLAAAGGYTTDDIATLKGHWRFEEGIGGDGATIADISGNGNNGEVVGEPTWQSSVPTGPIT